jgi:phosphoribosylanthranilate isomerase
MKHRTRIKLCGLTQLDDVKIAGALGADAIGLVFFRDSPRYVSPERAAQLVQAASPYVSTVGLFVNAAPEEVEAVVSTAPVSMLQFHGDETMEQCFAAAQAVNRRFLRALRVRPDMTGADLLEYEDRYRARGALFAGLLLDAFVDGYGGGGKVFDWSLIPEELAPRVVLSGGLSVHNATDAIARVRPFAVDVSSGIEAAKGVKDPARMHAFVEAVRLADASAPDLPNFQRDRS